MSAVSSSSNEPRHTPVLLTTVLDTLSPHVGDTILDCTTGLGGHSEAFAHAIGSTGTLVCLDADQKNLSYAKQRLKDASATIHFVHANFRQIPDCMPNDVSAFDIIFADLGLSSPHIDDAARGFTFHGDAPLDMRFDQSSGDTAADMLHHSSVEDLTKIFQDYGELPMTHRFVRAITEVRSVSPLKTASDLRAIIDDLYSHKASQVLPQIFQALRIAVNDEMGALEHLLSVAPTLLKPSGRLGVISYHSLEDRLVKHAFRSWCTAPKDEVTGQDTQPVQFTLMTKKPLVPAVEEIENNSRARSALFRIMRYTPTAS